MKHGGSGPDCPRPRLSAPQAEKLVQSLGGIVMRSSFALIALMAFGSVADAATDCEGLAKLTLQGVAIHIAQAVPSGSFTPPGNPPIANLPAFCRVAGVIRPTADSRSEERRVGKEC